MSHDHVHDLRGRKLILSMVLNLAMTMIQIIGGIFSGSLSLLSDALHNLTDVMALFISWAANKLSRKECSPQRTFGTKRIELFAALVNGVMLVGISLYIIVEAIERLESPPVIDSIIVISLGAMAIGINGLCALLFRDDSRESLNIRSVYLNLLTDMMASVAVLVGGLLMWMYGIYWVDIIITLIISVALLYSAVRLIQEAVRIFMLFTPEGIDPFDLEQAIVSFPAIKGIHHMHVWQLVEDELHLEAHVDFQEDLSITAVDAVLTEVQETVRSRFGITHITLQPEFGRDDRKELIMPLDKDDHCGGQGHH